MYFQDLGNGAFLDECLEIEVVFFLNVNCAIVLNTTKIHPISINYRDNPQSPALTI